MNAKNIFKTSALTTALLMSLQTQADQQILDNLIVQGSVCVGLDCNNGESFGFDTIRLKENNVRIKFQDTSTSSSFPSNDWQLTANDSANGGANRFSIDDIDGGKTPFTVEAGARTNALYIDDVGRIGVGTNAPVVNVHIKEGNTPTIRLEQDGSSGFSAQTWDVAGNESNFFVRDATNSGTLPFRIQPGASNASIYIASDGDVGFETTTPDGQFDVAHSADANNHAFLIDPSSNVGVNIVNGGTVNGLFDVQDGSSSSIFSVFSDGNVNVNGTATTESLVVSDDNGIEGGEITLTDKNGAAKWYIDDTDSGLRIRQIGYANQIVLDSGSSSIGFGVADPTYPIHHYTGAHLTSGGVWADASSRQLKQNITSLSLKDALEALKRMSPVTFNYISEPNETYLGFIAEDVPDLVAKNDRKSLAPMDIIALLTKIVQYQDAEIKKIKKSLVVNN